MNEPLPPLNREFDYHRIPGGDAAYRANYDSIFRKKVLTEPAESEKPESDSAVEQPGSSLGS